MAQRVGSVIVHKCYLIALICAAVRPAYAQVTPDPASTPVQQVRLDLAGPEDTGAKRPRAADRPANTQFTFEQATPDSSSPRVLHYRLDRLDPAGPSDDNSAETLRDHDSVSVGAARAADAGLLLPYTLTPRVYFGQSWVRAVAGYDTAATAFRARSVAESAVTNYFAVRVEYEHGPAYGFQDRIGLGGRFQVLNQKKHGIDGGFAVFYQPKDFRGEGNVVGGLMLGRRFGRLGLFGSALFGSDPEGDDQDLDGRMSVLYRVGDHLEIGWDNRIRYVLSTDAKRFGTVNTDWELALEPTATVTLGPLAIISEAGFSALQNSGPIGQLNDRRIVHTGVIAMAGAGAAF